MASEIALSVRDLSIGFHLKRGCNNAVEDICFDLREHEKLGIVGESGSGKSIICRSLLRLLPSYATVCGQALYKGKNLIELTNKQMYAVRGKEISMIFQEPMTSLNPLFTIGNQLIETICKHQRKNRKASYEHAIEMLRLVGIPLPERRMKQYPFELSGGMRQRIMIAIALSCNPNILIADEPTTALDVTIQAQILELINELNEKLGTSLIMITHDLGVIAETVESVMVMYAGHIMEIGRVSDIFNNPLHPYTQGLLAAMPTMESKRGILRTIPGFIPSIDELPKGCRFAPRCSQKQKQCDHLCPPVTVVGNSKVRCWNYIGGSGNYE